VPLRIDILKYQGQPARTESPVVINEEGGTIGRSTHNAIVLRDETVSRQHAQISFQHGHYYLTDRSSNGTLIYNRDLTIEDEEVELLDGDILRIGDYELRVSIIAESHAAKRPSDFDTPPSPSPPRARSAPERSQKRESGKHPYPEARSVEHAGGSSVQVSELNIDDFFRDTEEEEKSGKSEGAGQNFDDFFEDLDDLPPGPAVQSQEEAPEIGAKAPEAPEVRQQPEAARIEQPAPANVAEPVSEAPAKVNAELFERFLKGAGIEMSSFKETDIPELMENLGAVFRELVNGLWTVLRGRAELKAEIRIPVTMVRPASNNPLKFSPTLDDAVRRLVKRDHPSFLEPLEAVRESFGDIMNHQVAVHAGIQASLIEALDRFDPDRISENKDGSILQTKSKLWKAYCQVYPELKEEALEDIFGKAFIQAYEDQLEKFRFRSEAGNGSKEQDEKRKL
jgi:type VI secretion system protein